MSSAPPARGRRGSIFTHVGMDPVRTVLLEQGRRAGPHHSLTQGTRDMSKLHRCMLRPAFSTLLLLVLIGWTPVAAQSVDAVVDAMKARYQQELETVDTYIIETNQYTSYHRKTSRDGEPMYETAMRWQGDGNRFFSGTGATSSLQPSLAQLDTLAQVATYEGTETVDGRRCHVLRVDDLSALSSAQMPGMDDETTDQGSMRMYIDAERSVPLRMDMEVQVTQNGEPQTVRPQIRFSDYRTADGLTLPWMMEMTMENVNASISPEEREQARQSLEELEARMNELPEAQRRMMAGMMEGQMEQLRSMLEDGSIRFAVEVQNVQVNTPLPDDVFDSN